MLVLSQGIRNQREQTHVAGKGVFNPMCRSLSHRPVAVREVVKCGGDSEQLGADWNTHRCNCLVKQPQPSPIRDVLFMQQSLEFIRKLMRPKHPQILQPWPPPVKLWLKQQLREVIVTNPIYFKRKE